MVLIKYIILGIIQGFTEPIPVSSSGHLLIFKEIFKMDVLYDLNFEIIVNFGSLIAIIFIYKKELIELINGVIKYIKTKNKKYKNDFDYFMYIIIATIPVGILGFLLKDFIEGFSNVKAVGISLLVTAGLLYLISRIKGSKDDKQITYKDAIYIGVFQVFALIPGISRSGITLTAGMFRNLKKEVSLKYSFMLYIPVSLATMLLGVSDFVKSASFNTLWFPYLMGMIASSIVTYFAFKWFRNILLKNKLIYFIIYCVIVGLLTIFVI